MKELEKLTMHVDYSHLSDYPHEDQNFLSYIVSNFYRYEPDLQVGLTKFMQDQAGNSEIKSFFQVAIYNLP